MLWIWGLITNLAEVKYKCCTYQYLYFSKSQTLVRIWVWLDFNNFHDIGSALRVWCCNSFEDTDLYYCWHFKSLGGHPPFWRVCWHQRMKEGGERWHLWDVVLTSIWGCVLISWAAEVDISGKGRPSLLVVDISQKLSSQGKNYWDFD